MAFYDRINNDSSAITLVKNAVFSTVEPRHFMKVYEHENLVEILWNKRVIARTTKALSVREVGSEIYPERLYLPRDAVRVELIQSSQTSFCQLKGTASYFQIEHKGHRVEIAWSYLRPLPTASKLASYISFDTQKVAVLS